MYTVLYTVVLGWALASTEHIITVASSNISINSLTATKSSDTVSTVYKCQLGIFQSQAQFFSSARFTGLAPTGFYGIPSDHSLLY